MLRIEDLNWKTKIAGIYKIENLVNGKFYIGSSVDLYKRRSQHFNQLKKNTHHCTKLQSSFNKYGSANFIFSILELSINLDEELQEREQYYFNKLKPLLNSSDRAYKPNTINPKLRKEIHQYSLKGEFLSSYSSLSEADKITGISLKAISRSITLSKVERTSGGFQWRYASSIGTVGHVNIGRSRAVYQYSLDGNFIKKWESCIEASKELGGSHYPIYSVLSGKNKTAFGFIWKDFYADKLDVHVKYGNGKPIEKYSLEGFLLKEYTDIKEAERDLGIDKFVIWNIISGRTKNKKNRPYTLRFKYND